MLAGAVAAALGLGSIAVVVLLLWVASPYPDTSGPNGALRIAADLWLLAHGAMLVREETRAGSPAPVGLTPLLLCALPVWLLYRAARHALEQAEPDGPEPADATDTGRRDGGEDGPGSSGGFRPVLDREGARSARGAIGWLCAGYLAVAAVAVVHASGGPLRVDPVSALLHLPPVAAVAASAGVWTAYGRPPLPVPSAVRRLAGRLPGRVRTRLRRPRLIAAGRAAAAGTAALVGCGALLVAASLAWHGSAAQQSFADLSQPWPGRLALFLMALALVPNAAIWAASYGLGAGFSLGEGCTAGLPAAAGCPAPADFPLLAAVPQGGHGGPLIWGAAVVPLAAGLTLGWFTARSAVDRPGAPATCRGTALTGLLAALGCGLATGCLAGWAGGPLGTGALARFGPDALAMGAAATAATSLIGVASALALRAWWLGRRSAGPARTGAGMSPAGAEPAGTGDEPWSVWEVSHRPDESRANAAEPWWRLWERPAGRSFRRTRTSSPVASVMPLPRASADAPLAGPDATRDRQEHEGQRPGWFRRAMRALRSAGAAAARRLRPVRRRRRTGR